MSPALSSTVTTPYRYILPGQANFTESPELALESLLTSYGVPQANLFVKHLVSYVKGDHISFLKLLTLLDIFGISQVASWLQLCLGEGYEKVKKDLEYVLPFSAAIDYKNTFDVVVSSNFTVLPTDYIGYPSFNTANILEDTYILEWVIKAEPALEEELSFLKRGDLLFFIVSFVSRITTTDLALSATAIKKLSSCLAKTLSLGALGDTLNQELYFPYVSAVTTNS